MFKVAIDGNDGFFLFLFFYFYEAGGVNLNLRQVTTKGDSILHVVAKSRNAQIMKKVLVIDPQQ